MTFICPDSLNMCSLSSYKQRERRECGYSRRFYRLNVYTTNLYPPTGNLDSKSCKAVIDAFLQAKREMGATIFMVTHDSFAASFCDRVIVLKDGQVYGELKRKGTRREFMDGLLDTIRTLGGDGDDNE